ncbi:MAG: glycosyltransferase family 2 protein [Clostridia bacterium]|nr:glycosyltransferase family 2 protein [Clostridia bacterium]
MNNNKSEKKVIAVVVTYNRKELLKECIEALINQNYKSCNILIVDNNSTDGTREHISKYVDGKKVIYDNTGKNLGGAGGFNYGVKKAYELGYDYIWIMDDDCIVHKDSLEKLMIEDENLQGNYGFLSSKVLWKDGNICKMNRQRKSMVGFVRDFKEDIIPIEMATFVSLLFKASVVKEVGLPIKDFFIWTDDLEYTRRISLKYKCYLVSNSIVTHKSKDNNGANIVKDSPDRLERYKYAYRNEVYLYRREGIKGMLYVHLRNIYTYLRILFANNENKIKKINIVNQSTKEGKKFNPKIEKV